MSTENEKPKDSESKQEEDEWNYDIKDEPIEPTVDEDEQKQDNSNKNGLLKKNKSVVDALLGNDDNDADKTGDDNEEETLLGSKNENKTKINKNDNKDDAPGCCCDDCIIL